MIRDRLVVGLQDTMLEEKLQLGPDLTLKKAITTVQQSEAVKKRQVKVKGENRSVDSGHSKKSYKDKKPSVPSSHAPQNYTCTG